MKFQKCCERPKTYNGLEFWKKKIVKWISLNPFVPNNANVPTINPNAYDRNNLNPNVRPVFWDTSVCVCATRTQSEEIYFHCSMSQEKMYVLLYSSSGFDKTAIYLQIELLAHCVLLWASALKKRLLQSVNSVWDLPNYQEIAEPLSHYGKKLSSLIPKISSILSPWEESVWSILSQYNISSALKPSTGPPVTTTLFVNIS